MFPDAEVRAELIPKDACTSGPNRVTISAGGEELVVVPQRDLFSKYDWPAEDTITAALTKFKAEREG